MTGRPALVAVVLGIAAGCSDGGSIGWNATTAPDIEAVGTAVAVDELISVRFGDDCGQLEVGDERTMCPPFQPGGGMVSTLRAGGLRIVWIPWRSAPESDEPGLYPIDRAVVWSSASPDGRVIRPVVSGDMQQIVWVMADGEEPWGVQTLDASDRLIAAYDLVGLPGD